MKRRPATFNEIVRDVKEHPLPVVDDRTRIRGSDGTIYRLAHDDISQARAADLVASGAQLLQDSCGCGGACGYAWIDQAEANLLMVGGDTADAATIHVAAWHSDGGGILVVFDGDRIWGHRLR